nr:MAG TPA: hypothetical protein [Bacteriophage sp.]
MTGTHSYSLCISHVLFSVLVLMGLPIDLLACIAERIFIHSVVKSIG